MPEYSKDNRKGMKPDINCTYALRVGKMPLHSVNQKYFTNSQKMFFFFFTKVTSSSKLSFGMLIMNPWKFAGG